MPPLVPPLYPPLYRRNKVVTSKSSLIYLMLLAADAGVAALGLQGFKDTAFHDFMFKASETNADSLPISMKFNIVMSHYVRVT